jgi:hypothetical protein
MRFLFWPAIPTAFVVWLILGRSDDYEKTLLVLFGVPLLLSAILFLAALVARFFHLLPSLIGAMCLSLLSIGFVIVPIAASFAPHGPGYDFSAAVKFQLFGVALAYLALVLLGRAFSAYVARMDEASAERTDTDGS